MLLAAKSCRMPRSDSERSNNDWKHGSRYAKAAEWRSLQDVRKTYSHADGVKVGDTTYTVFNIGGNKFRLIARY